jgi:hypothetical protein
MIVSAWMSHQFATDITLVTYNRYLQLGVDGLRGLQNFNVNDQVSLVIASPAAEVSRLTISVEVGSSAQQGMLLSKLDPVEHY